MRVLFHKLFRKIYRRVRTYAYRLRAFAVRAVYFLTHKDVIVHFGLPQRDGELLRGNVGDPYLFIKMERMIDSLWGPSDWLSYDVTRELSWGDLFLINHFSKCILVGGHGLIMRANGNTGWLFNISTTRLRKIHVPIIFASIGFNSFRGQKPFGDDFRDSVNCCIERSIFFGLRNMGSIRSLEPYIEDRLNKNRISLQPCPTTIVSCFERHEARRKTGVVAICMVFDFFENRFENGFESVFLHLIEFANKIREAGKTVQFFVHCEDDCRNQYALKIGALGYEIRCVSNVTLRDVEQFYLSNDLVVGMRGHSLMIPWGLGIPVISLTNQDKQKFFMELIGHPELSIEADSVDCSERLLAAATSIFNNYDDVLSEMQQRQAEFWRLTKENFDKIKAVLDQ